MKPGDVRGHACVEMPMDSRKLANFSDFRDSCKDTARSSDAYSPPLGIRRDSVSTVRH